MIRLVDTHAHIDLPEFDTDRDEVIERAWATGVATLVVIGFNPARWRTTADLVARYPNIRRAAGIHPNNAALWSDDVAMALRREFSDPGVVAVGEIGLDYYRNDASPTDQRRCFADQLEIARAADLPIIIHQRAAELDLLEVLRPLAPLRGVLHCFSGDSPFAEACLELGLHLGVGGVMTYPRSHEIREAVAAAPIERLLIETDAPYLAPQGHRGKRNEPAFVRMVVEHLASVRDDSIDRIAEATTANAIALFGSGLANARAGAPEITI